MNESINQWISDLIWTNEPMNPWTTEPMNQWIHESMNSWILGPMDEGMDEWMDGWASYFFLLSYVFTQRPLRWGTSSLSSFFSEQPLVWTTSALSCLPARSSVAPAIIIQVFSSHTWYNASSNLQLQSRIAQEKHYGQELPFAQLLQC